MSDDLERQDQILGGSDATKNFEGEDSSSKIWKLYGEEAEKHDQALTESWNKSMDTLLIFTGLFSAIVSAFIIETYKSLQPDSGSSTVALLSQLVAQSGGNSSAPSSTLAPSPTPFTPPTSAIRINILMFLSLFLSLACALVSTLVQQWIRDYLRYSRPGEPPLQRGRVRAYLFQGLNRSEMKKVIDGVPVFLHISVFVFFFALSDFLLTINDLVGCVARYAFIILLLGYLIFSILPLISSDFPYQTALTTPLRPIYIMVRCALNVMVWAGKSSARRSWRTDGPAMFTLTKSLEKDRTRVLKRDVEKKIAEIDGSAFLWLLQRLDNNRDIDLFVESLPGYLNSPSNQDQQLSILTLKHLVAGNLLERIQKHLETCVTSKEIPRTIRTTRALASAGLLRDVCAISDTPFTARGCIVDNYVFSQLDSACNAKDPLISLRASCIRSLAVHVFLGKPPSSITHKAPLHLQPLIVRLCARTNTSSRQWRGQSIPIHLDGHSVSSAQRSHDVVLYDGPIINLALLARDTLTLIDERNIDLDMVHTTLETLQGAFGVNQACASPAAIARFDEVYEDVRGFVGSQGGPSRAATLLEAMGSVRKGLQIASVFAYQRDSPPPLQRIFHPLHELIFGSRRLGDETLMTAFSERLSGFIEKAGVEQARAVMEQIVLEDGFWARISEHIKAQKQNSAGLARSFSLISTYMDLLHSVFILLGGSPVSALRWLTDDLAWVFDSIHEFLRVDDIRVRAKVSLLMKIYCAVHQGYHTALMQAVKTTAKWESGETTSTVEERKFLSSMARWLELGTEEDRAKWKENYNSWKEAENQASTLDYIKRDAALAIFRSFGSRARSYVSSCGPADQDKVWATLRSLAEDIGEQFHPSPVERKAFAEFAKQVREAPGIESLGPLLELTEKISSCIQEETPANAESGVPEGAGPAPSEDVSQAGVDPKPSSS